MNLHFVAVIWTAITLTGMAYAAPDAELSLTTLSGKHYHKVQIKTVDPDGLRITHKDGAAKIQFTHLNGDIQTKYGYDSTAAIKFQAQQEMERKEEAKRRAQADQESYDHFRQQILVKTQTTPSSFAAHVASIEDRIAQYRSEDKTDWAKTLESDLETLNKHELARHSKAVDARNEKLQEDILQFQTVLSQSQERSSSQVRGVTYYSSGFPYPYYYNHYQPRCYTPITPRPCPPVRWGPIVIVR